MRLYSLLGVWLCPAVLGAPRGPPNPTSGGMTGGLNGMGLMSGSFIASITNEPQTTQVELDYSSMYPGIRFTPRDYAILARALRDPATLRSLLIGGMINFDLSQLSLGRQESIDSIQRMVQVAKTSSSNYLRFLVTMQSQFPSVEEAHERYRVMLDQMEMHPDFDTQLIEKVRALVRKNPNYPQYFRIAVEFLKDTFDPTVLDMLRDYFQYANSYKPRVSEKIKGAVEAIQSEFQLFPYDFFEKVRNTFDDVPYIEADPDVMVL